MDRQARHRCPRTSGFARGCCGGEVGPTGTSAKADRPVFGGCAVLQDGDAGVTANTDQNVAWSEVLGVTVETEGFEIVDACGTGETDRMGTWSGVVKVLQRRDCYCA